MKTQANPFLTVISFFTLLTAIAVIIVLSITNNTAYAETKISAARIGSGPNFTRFTLESNAPINYSLIMLENPGRVVIDLENIALTPLLKDLPNKIQLSDPLIKKLRIGRFKPHVLRLVFDLKVDVVPQAFTIDPTSKFGHRLVVDIYSADLKAEQFDDLDQLVATLIQNKPDISESSSSMQSAQQKIVHNARRSKPNPSREIIIAIDAGHGGKDPGALGPNGAHEKDITLAISKKLKTRIDLEPNIKAILIRDGDYFIKLESRISKARRMNADLFISIHADAAKRKSARGSSVYTLSQHGASSTMASWLAKKENSADRHLIGGIDLISKSGDLKEILIDLSMSATINDSVTLAQHVLEEIGSINRLHKKQVERAPFMVLKSPDIPSILVETAFISNPEDEKKLKTQDFQDRMAKALHMGIKRYLASGPALARTSIAQTD